MKGNKVPTPVDMWRSQKRLCLTFPPPRPPTLCGVVITSFIRWRYLIPFFSRPFELAPHHSPSQSEFPGNGSKKRTLQPNKIKQADEIQEHVVMEEPLSSRVSQGKNAVCGTACASCVCEALWLSSLVLKSTDDSVFVMRQKSIFFFILYKQRITIHYRHLQFITINCNYRLLKLILH